MPSDTSALAAREGAAQGTLTAYTIGFILSIVLTLIPYFLVQRHVHHATLSRPLVIVMIALFAVTQLGVQLVCFLHLDKGSQRRWNILVLLFAAIVVVVLVFGSLWIMHNLNYRMSPTQMQQYVSSQSGF
jgi:cytochrome o ubiquinol oxidase operon protein cyoD